MCHLATKPHPNPPISPCVFEIRSLPTYCDAVCVSTRRLPRPWPTRHQPSPRHHRMHCSNFVNTAILGQRVARNLQHDQDSKLSVSTTIGRLRIIHPHRHLHLRNPPSSSTGFSRLFQMRAVTEALTHCAIPGSLAHHPLIYTGDASTGDLSARHQSLVDRAGRVCPLAQGSLRCGAPESYG